MPQEVNIQDQIKELENHLNIVCLTKSAKPNQGEPQFFEFSVTGCLHIPEITIKLYKNNLNIKSTVAEIVKQSYSVGFTSGIEYGNRQIVSKFKTLFEL